MTTFVDVAFPCAGPSLPLDHGYPLFGALSRRVTAVHERAAWAVHPVRGARAQDGLLALDKSSFVKIRLPADDIGLVLPLAGATLDVAGHMVSLSPPRVFPLVPASSLRARVVTVNGHCGTPVDLADSVRRKLPHLDLGQDAERIEVRIGRRHVFRVGPSRPRQRVKSGAVVDADLVVGFEVELHGLEAPASLVVQERGLGGRRHLGAGIFTPFGKAAR